MFLKLLVNFLVIILFCNFLTLNASDEIKVSCKNEEGENVDWFYLYKLPAHYSTDKTVDYDKTGLRYMYLTNASYEQWNLSSNRINETSSMVALTLEPLVANPLVLLLAYNDEFPNGQVIFDGGHTKGVIATDGNTGIWLIHSVPKFPSLPKYEYPSTGAHYGQSFLCVTFNASEMEKIGEQLLFNEPNIYYERVPVTLSEKFPHLEQAIRKEWISMEPFNNILDLKSLQGINFKSFAKTSKYNKELYEDFVAPTLDTNLLVETWRNGKGNFNSNCSLNDNVYNIQAIEFNKHNIQFNTTQDHSKWAVSQSVGLKFWRWRLPSTSNWICVGDINRQQHQLQRGGGVLCQQQKKLAKLYKKLVQRYESCS
ncbi:plancitoxin-1 [Lucilia sericata]|uniref:plancitoxin-1 n=1 Tax=Lucilia sericata TaxID=13632 RepID=UPI0018A87B85|nr:plancitoxin-1 [Lucilia sericata]